MNRGMGSGSNTNNNDGTVSSGDGCDPLIDDILQTAVIIYNALEHGNQSWADASEALHTVYLRAAREVVETYKGQNYGK